MNLFQKLFDQHKVYVVPGSEFGCKMFGWFRINFAVDSKMLEVGMNRIERALTGSTQATEANHVGVGQDTTMNADMKEDEMMTNTKRMPVMKACFQALIKICGCSYSRKYTVTEDNV